MLDKTGQRVVALIIIQAADAARTGNFKLLAALLDFLDSYQFQTTLWDLVLPVSSEPIDVPGMGVTDGVAWNGGVVVAGVRNATGASDVDAALATLDVTDGPTAGANLNISKTADPPDKVATGAQVLYTLKVFNQGPDVADNVVLIDTLPPNLTRAGEMPSQCELAFPLVTCNLGTVPVAGVGVSKVFRVRAPAEPGIMVNTARIGGSGSAEAETVVEEAIDVRIKLTGPDRVSSRQQITFKMTVINFGPPVATDVEVVFSIHPAIELRSFLMSKGECERTDPPLFANDRTEVRCKLPKMTLKEEWDIDVIGLAGLLEAKAVNKAEVFIQQAETEPSNNQAEHSIELSGDAAADVAVRLAFFGRQASGYQVQLFVSNDGPSKATNVQLTVEALAGIDLSKLESFSSDFVGEGVADCGGEGSCTLSIGTIGSGEIKLARLTFSSNAENISIDFQANASRPPDPDRENNQFRFDRQVALGAGSQRAKLQILEQPSPILPPPAAVTNSAAGNNFFTVSAGSGHTVWGMEFSSNVRVADGGERVPIDLDGVKVRLTGIPAPLFFVAPNQINFQTPWELLRDTLAEVRVEIAAVTTMPIFVRVAIHDPGIFTTNQSGSGQGAILIANSASVAAPAGMFPGSQPVARGGFISIFGNGLGPVSDPPPTGAGAWTDRLASTQTLAVVTIDGVDAPVFFSGLEPGFVGLYQVNAQVPEGASTSDAVDLSVTIGGVESNGVTIAISE